MLVRRLPHRWSHRRSVLQLGQGTTTMTTRMMACGLLWAMLLGLSACGKSENGCSEGQACDDGDPCTTGDVCTSGRCQGTALACDDGNACTTDRCEAGSCVHVDDSAKCDDQNPCTDDLCSPQLGCLHQDSFAPCDDHDPCTQDDVCRGGACHGTRVPSCGAPSCGDDVCQEGETCAGCPADCSPIGGGECGAACDPLAETIGCGANFVCLPFVKGAVERHVLAMGNGVCGLPCAGPTDCAGSTCVGLDGASRGVCAPDCTPGAAEPCGPAGTCFPLASQAGKGVCLLAEQCDPAVGDGLCFKAAQLAVPGIRPRACFVQDPGACDGLLSCIPRTNSLLHQGQCFGQATPCDPVAQTGCKAGETCTPLGGGAMAGFASVCVPSRGSANQGEACVQQECATGLVCRQGRCRALCAPGGAACAEGSCGDASRSYYRGAGTLGICGAPCGDGVCDASSEDCLSCAADCGPCASTCGDGRCTGSEDCSNCAEDCGECVCGDGRCTAEETCTTCPDDCGACPVCGDGVCNGSEWCASCPLDCKPCEATCGDGKCGAVEYCFDCPGDCGSCPKTCGDGVCSGLEDCNNCSADCGACPGSCGDGVCAATEDCASCPADCSLLGGVHGCGPACDPTAPASGCDANHACVTTEAHRLVEAAFEQGNGVCGGSCTGDADCRPGVCLPLADLSVFGVCAPACVPGTSGGCAVGQICLALPQDAARGACVHGTCGATAACGYGFGCAIVAGSSGRGACLPSCWGTDSNGCGALACHTRTNAPWREGTCLGSSAVCDPIRQTGCAASETCTVLSGAGLNGRAYVCRKAGATLVTDPCGPGKPECAAGLICYADACRTYCDPLGTACPGGACADLSEELLMPLGTLGVCR